jgi:hypothetical protein
MKYLWALLGLAYALLSIYVGYLFVTSATGESFAHKSLALQSAPFLGGIGIAVFAIPLIWNSIRLATSRTDRY